MPDLLSTARRRLSLAVTQQDRALCLLEVLYFKNTAVSPVTPAPAGERLALDGETAVIYSPLRGRPDVAAGRPKEDG
jgi:hypothetical protein